MTKDDDDSVSGMTPEQYLENLCEGQAYNKLASLKWHLSGDRLVSRNVESKGNAEIVTEGLSKYLQTILGFKASPVRPDKPDDDCRLELSAKAAVPFFRGVLQKKLDIIPHEREGDASDGTISTQKAVSELSGSLWYDKGDCLESSVSFNAADAAKCIRILNDNGVRDVTMHPSPDDLLDIGNNILRTTDKRKAELFLMMFAEKEPAIQVQPMMAQEGSEATREPLFENRLDHRDRSFLRMLEVAENERAASRSTRR